MCRQTDLPGISPVPPAPHPRPGSLLSTPERQATRGRARGPNWGVAGAANRSCRKEGAEAKKGSSRRTGWGWGEPRNYPGEKGGSGYSRVGTAISTRPEIVCFFFTKRNCWRRPERWEPKEGRKRRQPGGRAGRPAQRRRTRGRSCPRRGGTARGPAGPKSRTGS